jgi:hypothetical protein
MPKKSGVFIDHVLGEVFVRRGKEKKEVEAGLVSDLGSFHLQDGDKVITGKDGYVVSIAERKKGKYNSYFKIGCNSEVFLNINTSISKIDIRKGWIVVETNAEIEAPLVEIKRVEDKEMKGSADGDSVFVLIKVENEKVKVTNKGFPVEVIHKKKDKSVRLMGHEQATATSSKLKLKSDADKDVRSILSKFMELDSSLADSVTNQVLENMKKLEKRMRKEGGWKKED